MTPCQRKGCVRPRWCRKKRKAAPSAIIDTTIDFSVSCSISSLGTPRAGARNIIRASRPTVQSPVVTSGGKPPSAAGAAWNAGGAAWATAGAAVRRFFAMPQAASGRPRRIVTCGMPASSKGSPSGTNPRRA